MAEQSSTPTVLISSRTRHIRVPRKKITGLVRFIARHERRAIGEVDILVVDSQAIAKLNRQYLGHRGATDVISFDLSAGEPDRQQRVYAQIIVCAQVAVREARRRGIGVQRELLLYVAHGLLHVLGYDDTKPTQADRMRLRQEELLAQFLEARR